MCSWCGGCGSRGCTWRCGDGGVRSLGVTGGGRARPRDLGSAAASAACVAVGARLRRPLGCARLRHDGDVRFSEVAGTARSGGVGICGYHCLPTARLWLLAAFGQLCGGVLAALWWRLKTTACSCVCQCRHGGVVDCAVRWLTSNTMVVGLVTPAVSFYRGDDTGENSSLLGTASMAPLASFAS
jgi:hypothetical protein